jgi:ATP-binding cassette subfamily B multidrug efflux pump
MSKPSRSEAPPLGRIRPGRGFGTHPRFGMPTRGKIDFKIVKRLLSYMKQYKLQVSLVIACIVISAMTNVISSLFLKTLIDDYIKPLLLEAVPNFTALGQIILLMSCIYLTGVLAALFYNRIMVGIAQEILKRIRDQMFARMQALPIKYFDTHTHGDLMSHYTNDIDTLRQMLSMSVPQAISAAVTIVAVFCAMLSISVWLTLFVVFCVLLMLKFVGKIAGKSGTFFAGQQQSLGDVNGYIEEMVGGQKVVKVFCHEDKAKEMFDKKNEELYENAAAAHSYGNILMPVMHNFGYLLYILLAIVGGLMAVAGVKNISITGTGVLSLGMIASFLQLSRSFVMPISQVSQQINFVVMALAGAQRIFNLMDEKPEEDDGHVTLVNVKKENGRIVETEERTEMWAWKYPQDDGTETYTELKGEIRECVGDDLIIFRYHVVLVEREGKRCLLQKYWRAMPSCMDRKNA